MWINGWFYWDGNNVLFDECNIFVVFVGGVLEWLLECYVINCVFDWFVDFLVFVFLVVYDVIFVVRGVEIYVWEGCGICYDFGSFGFG